MNRIALVLLAAIGLSTAGWAADSLDDILLLAQRGLGEEVLMAKVETSPTSFALSTQDIVKLKDAHLSDRVIAAMIRHQGANQGYATVAQQYNTNDPVVGRPQAIEYQNNGAQVTRVVQSAQPTQVVYDSGYAQPIGYSSPVVYSSPFIYAGYSYPSYYGSRYYSRGYCGGYYGSGYYGGGYSRGYYGSGYYGGGYGRGYYGGGSYYGGGYRGGSSFNFGFSSSRGHSSFGGRGGSRF